MTQAIDGRFQTTDGVWIGYSRQPSPFAGAPQVALVHSLALDRSVWDGVVHRAAEHAEIVTYDCRGHGRSSRDATQPFTVELFARDLLQLLDHVGWESAAVGGCSMGGCIAMALAGAAPARASSLLLIDTTAWYGPDAPQQFRARAEAARAKGMAGLVDFQISRWFSATFPERHPDLVEKYTRTFIASDFECYARSCALLGDADLRPYLAVCRMPVSILVGEDDQATPLSMAKALHEAIPHSTLDVIEGARHLTPIECPDRVADALVSLLTSSRTA